MWVQVRQKLQLKLTGSSDANETHLKIPQGSWNLTPLGFLALALLFFFGGGPVRCGVRPPGRIRKARLVFPGPLQYHPTGTPLAPNSRTSRTFCRLIIDGYHTTITWYYAWCEPTTFISGLSVRCVYKICSFLKYVCLPKVPGEQVWRWQFLYLGYASAAWISQGFCIVFWRLGVMSL